MGETIDTLLNYINKYDLKVKENKLKLLHTYRVAEYCEKIAISENLLEGEIKLAKLCGYLHDIGRFEQFRIYKTFTDKDSCDHGELGYNILKKDNFINSFIKDDYLKEVVLNSVKYHNNLFIPDNLDTLSEQILKIVRDADKIDILKLIVDKEIFINTNGEDISGYAFDSILNNKCLDKSFKKTNKDRMLTWIGFVFDFNFDYSLKIIRDKKYIEQIIDMYKDKNKVANERLEIIKKHTLNYIEEKVGKKDVRKKV